MSVSSAPSTLPQSTPPQLSEHDLVMRATPRILRALGEATEGFEALHEVPVGPSIADIVLRRSDKRAVSPEAALSANECMVLWALRRRRGAMLTTISQDTCLPLNVVESVVFGRLLEWRLVKLSDRRVVEARTAWVDRSRVIAVEAKLTRWRDALSQAVRYREYADWSYVLLPTHTIDVAMTHIATFRSQGIGLLGYDHTGVELYLEASRSKRHSWHREFALTRAAQGDMNGRHATARLSEEITA